MIVPLEDSPLLEFTPEHVPVAVESMRDIGLIGYVVRQYAPTAYQAFNRLAPVFAQQGYTRDGQNTLPFSRPEPDIGNPDRGYHIDRSPKPGHAPDVTAHYTTLGVVEASLIEVTEQAGAKLPIGPDLPQDLTEQIEAGVVDDEYFIPVRHTATLGEADVLAFRIAGNLTVAHLFQTVTYPRNSIATDLYQNPNSATDYAADPLDAVV